MSDSDSNSTDLSKLGVRPSVDHHTMSKVGNRTADYLAEVAGIKRVSSPVDWIRGDFYSYNGPTGIKAIQYQREVKSAFSDILNQADGALSPDEYLELIYGASDITSMTTRISKAVIHSLVEDVETEKTFISDKNKLLEIKKELKAEQETKTFYDMLRGGIFYLYQTVNELSENHRAWLNRIRLITFFIFSLIAVASMLLLAFYGGPVLGALFSIMVGIDVAVFSGSVFTAIGSFIIATVSMWIGRNISKFYAWRYTQFDMHGAAADYKNAYRSGLGKDHEEWVNDRYLSLFETRRVEEHLLLSRDTVDVLNQFLLDRIHSVPEVYGDLYQAYVTLRMCLIEFPSAKSVSMLSRYLGQELLMVTASLKMNQAKLEELHQALRKCGPDGETIPQGDVRTFNKNLQSWNDAQYLQRELLRQAESLKSLLEKIGDDWEKIANPNIGQGGINVVMADDGEITDVRVPSEESYRLHQITIDNFESYMTSLTKTKGLCGDLVNTLQSQGHAAENRIPVIRGGLSMSAGKRINPFRQGSGVDLLQFKPLNMTRVTRRILSSTNELIMPKIINSDSPQRSFLDRADRAAAPRVAERVVEEASSSRRRRSYVPELEEESDPPLTGGQAAGSLLPSGTQPYVSERTASRALVRDGDSAAKAALAFMKRTQGKSGAGDPRAGTGGGSRRRGGGH